MEEGKLAVGNSLERQYGTRYLTTEVIRKHAGIRDLSQIKSLDLRFRPEEDRKIRRVEGCLDECIGLEVLNLTGQAIAEIRDINALQVLRHLKELNLSKNKISSIDKIASMKNLMSLKMSLNDISRVPSCIKDCSQLRHLDLSCNRINNLESVKRIAKIPHLQTLILSGNPICQLHNYRLFCIYWMPFLFSLDGVAVQWDERKMAKDQF
eukprot:jgi/Bigna1/36062/e_gw1.12.219.1